jgi:predicted RNA methylase
MITDNADDPANVYGIDIDPDNIKWCKHNLAEGSFDHVGLLPADGAREPELRSDGVTFG